MNRIETYHDYVASRAQLPSVSVRSNALGRELLVPCMTTLLVRRELVVANDYNPNSVPPDKMRLLEQSIVDNGFCFPVVVVADDEQQRFVVIDGFHRTTIGGADWLDLDYVPIVVLGHGLAQRLAATVQFNKAKGHHQIDLDADLVRRLIEQGLTDQEVAERLGLDLDDVHRYKQVSGVAALFANTPYSAAWEMFDDDVAE